MTAFDTETVVRLASDESGTAITEEVEEIGEIVEGKNTLDFDLDALLLELAGEKVGFGAGNIVNGKVVGMLEL